jgi:hypothetical protein
MSQKEDDHARWTFFFLSSLGFMHHLFWQLMFIQLRKKDRLPEKLQTGENR